MIDRRKRSCLEALAWREWRVASAVSRGRAQLVAGILTFATACAEPTAPILPCDATVSDACWQFLGPAGTRVTSIDESVEGLWIGTRTDGVLRLSGGRSWIQDGLQGRWVSALAVDSRGQQWATLVASRIDSGVPAVYARDRAGRWSLFPANSWRAKDGALAVASKYYGAAFSISVSASRPGTVTVGLSAPVVRTTDDGTTWAYVFGNAAQAGLAVFAIFESRQTGGPLYAAAANGGGFAMFLRSRDGGASWSSTIPFPGGPPEALDVTAVPTDETIVLLATPGGIARSFDSGDHWGFPLVLPTPGTAWSFATSSDGSIFVVIALDAGAGDGSERLGLSSSDDRGLNWTALKVPASASGGRAARIASDGSLLVGTTNGVWRRRIPSLPI